MIDEKIKEFTKLFDDPDFKMFISSIVGFVMASYFFEKTNETIFRKVMNQSMHEYYTEKDKQNKSED